MGYDLHITRASDWTESVEHPISMAEWRKYIASDPGLRIDTQNSNDDDDLTVELLGPDEPPSLWWTEGRIEAKYPDPATVRKMTQLSVALGARVIGDDGEEYLPNGDVMEDSYTDKPPGLFTRLLAWLQRKPLPERKSALLVTRQWTDE